MAERGAPCMLLQCARGWRVGVAHLDEPPHPFREKAQESIRQRLNLLDLMEEGCALQP